MAEPQRIAQYDGELSWIVEDTVNSPETVIRAVLNLDGPINPESSYVFFIKPKKENDVIHCNLFIVFVPSGLVDRSVAGWIFEQVVHEFLICTKSITIHWFDEEPSSQTLELPSLDIRTMDTDLHSPPPFYWRPDSQNYPGIDGATVTNEHVYVIQATISRDHGVTPQEGVDKLWKAMPVSKVLEWTCCLLALLNLSLRQSRRRMLVD